MTPDPFDTVREALDAGILVSPDQSRAADAALAEIEGRLEAATHDAVFFRKGMVNADARAAALSGFLEKAEAERDEALNLYKHWQEIEQDTLARLASAEQRVAELEAALGEIADWPVGYGIVKARRFARRALERE